MEKSIVLRDLAKKLSLEEQLKYAQKDPHFMSLMQPLWQKKYEHFDYLYGLMSTKSLCDNEFDTLMKNICPTITKVELDGSSQREAKIMNKYRFPSVGNLSVMNFMHSLIDWNEVFPNVTYIKITKKFNWKSFWSQTPTSLQSMKIDDSADIEYTDFIKILQAGLYRLFLRNKENHLKEESYESIGQECDLKEVSISETYLPWLLAADLEYFTELEKLTLCSFRDEKLFNALLTELEKYTSEFVLDICFMDSMMPLNATTIKFELNIRELTLVRCETNELLKCLNCLASLQKLTLASFYIEDENEIQDILMSCKNLEYFGVQDTNFSFQKLTLNINDIMEGRRNYLRVNIHNLNYAACNKLNNLDNEATENVNNKKIQNMEFEFVGQSELFLITFEKRTLSFDDSIVFYFTSEDVDDQSDGDTD